MYEFTVFRLYDSRDQSFCRPVNKHHRGAFKKRFYSLEEAALFFWRSYKSLCIADSNLSKEEEIIFIKKFRAVFERESRKKKQKEKRV